MFRSVLEILKLKQAILMVFFAPGNIGHLRACTHTHTHSKTLVDY